MHLPVDEITFDAASLRMMECPFVVGYLVYETAFVISSVRIDLLLFEHVNVC